MNTEDFQLFLEKVPILRKWQYAVLTILYMICLIAISVLFFYFVNRVEWWGPLLSQAIMSVIVCIIGLLHFGYAQIYRKKYQDLAYQRFLYVFILPYLVTWYALFFHPAFRFFAKTVFIISFRIIMPLIIHTTYQYPIHVWT